MNGRWLNTISAYFALLIFSNMANAALVDRGGGLRYDTELDITWFPTSQSFGEHIDIDAINYANNATHYDPVRNVTYSDWRLPHTLDPDPSCNRISSGQPFGFGGYDRYTGCTGSEMAHLFSELNLSANGISDPASIGSFGHHNFYWSGTESTEFETYVWVFDFSSSEQFLVASSEDVFFSGSAWLVSDGDIAAIPVPAALWLFGSGLMGLFSVAKRKHRN